MSRKLELIIEDHNTVLYADIEDNPRLSDAIPLSTSEDNQLARDVDGYYVPPTSWEDMAGKPDSTTEEIDDAVSRSEQNESSIENLEQGKVDKVVGKELSSNDFTDTLRGKLEELENFDDSVIQAELANKVDKVVGKGLSTEDFTTAEKSKLAELEKFDDSLKQDLASPDKGASMVSYGDGTVADKLDEVVSGAVTDSMVDAKVDTHNHDANAHPELRSSIVSEVSSLVNGSGGGGSIPVEWIDVESAGVPLTDLSPDTMYILDVRSGNLIGIMIPENHSNIPVGAEYHFVCAGDPHNAHIYEDNTVEVVE